MTFIAELAESSAIGEARRKYLFAKKVVGMPTSKVKQLIGPPDREQDITGIGLMRSYNASPNMFQLTISGGTVTSVIKY